MAAKIIPFPGNNPERQTSPEEKQLLAHYFAVTDDNFMNGLRVTVYREDPEMVLEEDNIRTKQQPIAEAQPDYDPTQVTNNVVYLVNQQEQQALTDQQRMEEEARRAARREAA